jgi:hypothetical protein
MDVNDLNDYLQVFAHLTTIAGVPTGIWLYYTEKQKEREAGEKERKAREEKTFDELDDKYVEFMQLCLQHTDVDVFDPPLGDEYNPNPAQLRAEHALFAILISLFERAFVMFEYQELAFRQRQWDGWESLMKAYCYRKAFRRE